MSHSTVFNCEKPEDVHTPYHTEWSRVKCNLNVKCVRIVVGITCAHMHTQILSLLCSVTFVRMSLLRIILQECFCNFQCELIHYWLSIHSIIAQKLLAIFPHFYPVLTDFVSFQNIELFFSVYPEEMEMSKSWCLISVQML